MDKIGLGIITYNRQENVRLIFKKIEKTWCDSICIVNDGTPYDESIYPEYVEVIQHEKNKCVAASKNDAISKLMKDNCTHIFLMEDDVCINNPIVFEKYIKLFETTNIKHMNFGFHGPANFKNESPFPEYKIKYKNGNVLLLNRHCVGAFSYYHKDVINSVGLLDENFKNAWEHIEHTFRIIQFGFHPPFWYFADINESWKYIDELQKVEHSVISKRQDWKQNIIEGRQYFFNKHNFDIFQIPKSSKEIIINSLKDIKNKEN